MIRKTTIIMSFICVVAFASLASAQMNVAAKDVLSYLSGSWTTEYTFPGVGLVREETTYSKGANANTLKITINVFSGEKQIDSGTGSISYDPATNTVSSDVNSNMTGAVYTSHEVKRDGAITWLEGTSDDPMMAKFRVKIVVDSKDSHTWSMYLPDGDGWKQFMTTVYHRDKNK